MANLQKEAQDFLAQIVVKKGISGSSSRKTGSGIFVARQVGTSVCGVGEPWDDRDDRDDRQAAAPVGSGWRKVTSASLEV
jgi:hypothetical protein